MMDNRRMDACNLIDENFIANKRTRPTEHRGRIAFLSELRTGQRRALETPFSMRKSKLMSSRVASRARVQARAQASDADPRPTYTLHRIPALHTPVFSTVQCCKCTTMLLPLASSSSPSPRDSSSRLRLHFFFFFLLRLACSSRSRSFAKRKAGPTRCTRLFSRRSLFMLTFSYVPRTHKERETKRSCRRLSG